MRKFLSAAIVAGLLSSGCSIYGPERVMGPGGVDERVGQNLSNARHAEVIRRFVLLAARAHRIGFTVDSNGAINGVSAQDPVTSTQNQDLIHRFTSEGFTLINLNCSDYLTLLGNNQRRANVFRDSIGPIAALITGIVGIVAPGGGADGVNAVGQDWLSGIALGSSFATSGLDIYDQRFLFGAENIHSVRQLTIRALTTHSADATYTNPDNGSRVRKVLTFSDAVRHLRDNQELCTPAAILELSRTAIATGRLRAVSSIQTGGSAPAVPPVTPPPEPWNAAALRETLGDPASLLSDAQINNIFAALPAAPNGATLRATITQQAPGVELGLTDTQMAEIAATITSRSTGQGNNFAAPDDTSGTSGNASDIPPPESISLAPANEG